MREDNLGRRSASQTPSRTIMSKNEMARILVSDPFITNSIAQKTVDLDKHVE